MRREVEVTRITDERGPDCNGCGSTETTHIVRLGHHESWLCVGCAVRLENEIEAKL